MTPKHQNTALRRESEPNKHGDRPNRKLNTESCPDCKQKEDDELFVQTPWGGWGREGGGVDVWDGRREGEGGREGDWRGEAGGWMEGWTEGGMEGKMRDGGRDL